MNKVNETQLKEVEVLEQKEEEEEEVQEEEVKAAMKENQVWKALHKDVIFVRMVVMLKKIVGLRESLNILIARSLATCKRIIYFLRTINKLISPRRKKVKGTFSMHVNIFPRQKMIHGS